VFVLACFDASILQRGGRPVLAVGESRRRNPAKGKQAGQNTSPTTPAGFGDSGFARWQEREVTVTLAARDYKSPNTVVVEEQWPAGTTEDDVLATSICSKWAKGTGGPSGSEYYNLVVDSHVVHEK